MRPTAMLLTVAVAAVGLNAPGAAGMAAGDEQLSKKDFLEEANAVCKEAWGEVDAAFEEQFASAGGDGELSPEQIEAAVAAAVENLGGMAASLEALQGPVSLERKVDKFLERFEAVVSEFEADPQAAFAEELSGYPFAKPDKLARKIGLKRCAQRR